VTVKNAKILEIKKTMYLFDYNRFYFTIIGWFSIAIWGSSTQLDETEHVMMSAANG
jgi:hypothetical protein